MSVSSLEGSPVPLDLPAKYQKLAAEYAKIRAQLGVLKKAVVEEQNQTVELKEILKFKDQNLRKAEQELDSLNFRNQQLTKRVTILQDELDAVQNTSKSSKSKGANKENKNIVIMEEELQKKIAENARLISTLQEQTEKFENERFKLNQKIEIHEHKLKEYEENLSLIEETKVGKYENENKSLLAKLITKDEEIKKLNNEIRKLKTDLGGKNSALNNNSIKENFLIIIRSLSLEELLVSLSQFFQQLEFRYANHMENSQEFLKINKKNRLFLQDFIDKYLMYCNEGIDQDFLLGVENLCDNIQNYAEVLEVLYKCSDLSEVGEGCTTFKDIILKDLIYNIKRFWTGVNWDLKEAQNPNLSSLEHKDLIGRLIENFQSFTLNCDYFLSVFNEKFKSNSTNKESEKEILALLSKMSLQSTAVYKKLKDNTAILIEVLDYYQLKIKQKTAWTQCDHWKREFESLRVAHIQKNKDLKEKISCLNEGTTPCSTNSGNVQSPFEEKKEAEDGFNDGETGNSGDVPFIGEKAEIIKFFNARANKLVADRQYAESRVTVLKDECENLQRRLEHSLESRLILEDTIKQTQNTVSRLQEELQTTTINYEIQLQSMSEHMANMNEKFAAQEEQIEILKHQLTGKETKKGKS